jgi:hypothetical protein
MHKGGWFPLNLFTKRIGCEKRFWCQPCREDPEWRKQMGAPEECPYGITVENASSQRQKPEIKPTKPTITIPVEEGKEPKKGCGGCQKAIHGAVGLTKAALGIGYASPDVIAQRRATCAQCEHAMGDIRNIMTRCAICDCFLAAKTKLASEKCPIGKWLQEPNLTDKGR